MAAGSTCAWPGWQSGGSGCNNQLRNTSCLEIATSRTTKIRPLLTGTQRYEKVVSTLNRGHGQLIDAPILAVLIETPNGRILYDVGCDYGKITSAALSRRYFDPMRPLFEPPLMSEEQRIPAYLARLGLEPADIDIVFLGHLHFDHAGGLCDLPGCEVHVHRAEVAAAATGLDGGVFADEVAGAADWKTQSGDYALCPGVQAIETPGHTAGHMSLFVELTRGPPVILCGDAADLVENLDEEIAPGFCWRDNYALALASIRRLKSLAAEEKADLWPSHDFPAYRRWPQFPAWRD